MKGAVGGLLEPAGDGVAVTIAPRPAQELKLRRVVKKREPTCDRKAIRNRSTPYCPGQRGASSAYGSPVSGSLPLQHCSSSQDTLRCSSNTGRDTGCCLTNRVLLRRAPCAPH